MKKFSAAEFHAEWPEFDFSEFICYDEKQIRALSLSSEEESFLAESGLPEWPAPNIHFLKVFEIKTSDLICIGTDGDLNPICIDKSKNGRVVWITNGKLQTICYMNESISKLCLFLLEYRKMVDKAFAVNENSILENTIPNELLDELSNTLSSIDPQAVENKNTFWGLEISRLRSHMK